MNRKQEWQNFWNGEVFEVYFDRYRKDPDDIDLEELYKTNKEFKKAVDNDFKIWLKAEV